MALKSNMSILICEKDKNSKAMIKSVINSIGFKNITFTDDLRITASSIATNLKEDPFELVIINGDEDKDSLKMLVQLISKCPSKVQPKLLAVISDSNQKLIVSLIQLNIKHLIVRPFNKDQFIEKIANIFNQ